MNDRHRPIPARASIAAFTLVEIMVVIVGLLAAIAIPAFQFGWLTLPCQ